MTTRYRATVHYRASGLTYRGLSTAPLSAGYRTREVIGFARSTALRGGRTIEPALEKRTIE